MLGKAKHLTIWSPYNDEILRRHTPQNDILLQCVAVESDSIPRFKHLRNSFSQIFL
jgi:hypothetical protein